jgi:membrane protein YqaA with SNARE-associated domain
MAIVKTRKTTLLNSPIRISYYFMVYLVKSTAHFLHVYFARVIAAAVLLSISLYFFNSGYYLYWVSLGIASSIGLGTGLHTFVLFLAPFIAQKTIQYDGNNSRIYSVLAIYAQVYLEAFFWGFGTAIGELPPYFVSRAAALAGEVDPNFVSIEELNKKKKRTFLEECQVAMERLVENLGFWGILLCASVPNPFFDLAGIMCGRFGVDFWTFFGAVVIGKSIIKCTIQV